MFGSFPREWRYQGLIDGGDILKIRNVIFVSAYVLIFTLITHLSLQAIMGSTTQLTFPNFQFIITLIFMIAISIVFGLAVKKFINKTANGNKSLETNLKMTFVIGTVISSVLLFSEERMLRDIPHMV
jgi:hypothetical protein